MNRLSARKEIQIENVWKLRREAVRILGLVVSEWKSDPTSVQCFDLRLVEDGKRIIKMLEEMDTFGGEY